jgi:chemotaxis protein CheZ
VHATEAAANAIMQCAETVIRADASRTGTYRALVEQQMSAIFESCSFQDITGQQIASIIGRLQRVESELSGAASALLNDSSAGNARGRRRTGSARASFPALHGPQPEGQGNSQADVDALLCGLREPGI